MTLDWESSGPRGGCDHAARDDSRAVIWRRSLRTGADRSRGALRCRLHPAGRLYALARCDGGRQTIEAFEILLLDARQRSLLTHSALLATATAILATLIGAPLGLALSRVPLRHKTILRRCAGARRRASSIRRRPSHGST